MDKDFKVVDGLNSAVTEVKFETSGEVMAIRTDDRPEVVREVLKRNAELRNMPQRKRANMKHVASVPAVLHLEWMNEYNRSYKGKMPRDVFLKRKLNDFQNRDLRIWQGRV